VNSTRGLCAIIPTRNRRDDLLVCLASLSRQSCLPAEIIIVDSSTNLAGDEAEVYGIAAAPVSLRYIRARRAGVASQRNQGLDLVGEDSVYVLFLDDDVVLEPDYCAEMIALLDDKPTAAGVGGWIVNPQAPPFERTLYWFLRLFLIYGNQPGQVLSSGFNTPLFVGRRSDVFRAECLEGGNMCLRRDHLRDLQFDSRYERFAGYAYGEDLDFTYALGRRGELWVTPQARMHHNVSPAARMHEHRFGICQVVNRALFVRKHFGNSLYHLTCFVWSMLGIMLLNAGMVMRGRPMDRLLGNIVGLIVAPIELRRLFRANGSYGNAAVDGLSQVCVANDVRRPIKRGSGT